MKTQDMSETVALEIRRLMQLSPKARLDAILEVEKAAQLVRSMPAQDLYTTVLDVGLADASELLELASSEQFRACLDLAAWARDRVDPREVLAWLRAARGDDSESFLKKLHGLDLEIVEYMFRNLMRVHDLEENPDVNPPGVTMESPEGKYLLEFLVEGPEQSALRAVVEDLIAEDPFKAGRFFEAVRWEMPTELEEAAFRFRSARLADMGFPPLYEALSLYAYVDPEKVQRPEPGKSTGKGLEPLSGQRIDYVEAAFRGLLATEQENLEDEIRYLVNAALVAEGAEPGDAQAIRRISEMARDTLQLGLEFLCGQNPESASEVVQAHSLKRVFQVGFSLTLQLRFRVDRLAKQPLSWVEGQWLLLPEVSMAVKALHRRRPLRALKVEGAEPVPFRTRRELQESSRLIDRAEAQLAIFSVLLKAGVPEVERTFGARLSKVTPERLFASAMAHALLEGTMRPGPIEALHLVELAERWVEDVHGQPQVRSSMIEKTMSVFEPHVPDASQRRELLLMTQWVARWVMEEIGPPFLKEHRLEAAQLSRLPILAQAIL